MSMVEKAVTQAKEIKNRVINTIDAFRPKILIKKPLTEFKILGESEFGGDFSLVERIRARIEEIRQSVAGEVGPIDEEFMSPETSDVSGQTYVMKKRRGIHY